MGPHSNLAYAGLCILCCLCIGSTEQPNAKLQTDSPAGPTPRELAFFQLHGSWKATLLSRPFTYTNRLGDKEIHRTNTLYYVEVVTVDSKNPRRVWQHLFATSPSFPQSIPRNFIFGPVDEQRFCLAVLQAFTIYFFVLDSRDNLIPREDAVKVDNLQPQSARLIDYDPNAIVLEQVLGKEYSQMLGEKEKEISIDAISSYANYAVIHLSIGQQKLILKYSLGTEKPTCSVYQLTKLAK